MRHFYRCQRLIRERSEQQLPNQSNEQQYFATCCLQDSFQNLHLVCQGLMLMHLFAVRKFQKSTLIRKRKRSLFHSVVFLFCVKTLMPCQHFKKYFSPGNRCEGKRKCFQCVKAFKLCRVGCACVWAGDFYLLQPVKAAGDCDKNWD